MADVQPYTKDELEQRGWAFTAGQLPSGYVVVDITKPGYESVMLDVVTQLSDDEMPLVAVLDVDGLFTLSSATPTADGYSFTTDMLTTSEMGVGVSTLSQRLYSVVSATGVVTKQNDKLLQNVIGTGYTFPKPYKEVKIDSWIRSNGTGTLRSFLDAIGYPEDEGSFLSLNVGDRLLLANDTVVVGVSTSITGYEKVFVFTKSGILGIEYQSYSNTTLYVGSVCRWDIRNSGIPNPSSVGIAAIVNKAVTLPKLGNDVQALLRTTYHCTSDPTAEGTYNTFAEFVAAYGLDFKEADIYTAAPGDILEWAVEGGAAMGIVVSVSTGPASQEYCNINIIFSPSRAMPSDPVNFHLIRWVFGPNGTVDVKVRQV